MHEIIDNWNELSRYFSEPAKHFLDSNCKKINYFIVLVKDFGFLTE